MPDAVFASYSLLQRATYALPESERAAVYVTYPYTLPQDFRTFKARPDPLSKTATGPGADQNLELKMHALFQTLSGPLARMRSYVYRDFFIELIETAPDQSLAQGAYPRLSFGNGQRYASKGCYIVQLGAGPDPGLVKKSEWVIH
jgi:hypothetical protein